MACASVCPLLPIVRYVIDFYAGVPRPGGPPAAMFLDVRPALDSVSAAWDRLTMQCAWSQYSGGCDLLLDSVGAARGRLQSGLGRLPARQTKLASSLVEIVRSWVLRVVCKSLASRVKVGALNPSSERTLGSF
eukprot:1149834-Pelagomonas_calceolata.AAC.8